MTQSTFGQWFLAHSFNEMSELHSPELKCYIYKIIIIIVLIIRVIIIIIIIIIIIM